MLVSGLYNDQPALGSSDRTSNNGKSGPEEEGGGQGNHRISLETDRIY